ncbi:MAG: nicotinate-nucleotide adenylyltransferase [Gammaproteobacteria bacterium]
MSAASARPIGLLGGTFDPVHNGHLRVAIEACEALQLAEVRLLPLNTPGHRPPPVADTATRTAMLRAAARPPLVVDCCELERGGTSYTVDTLEHLRARFPHRALCLIIGLDSYNTLPTWHRCEELLTLAHVVVAARPDVAHPPLPGLDELIGNAQSERVSDLHDNVAGTVHFLDIPLLPIASSDLRARRRAGRSVRHLVPDAVADIVERQGLYRT